MTKMIRENVVSGDKMPVLGLGIIKKVAIGACAAAAALVGAEMTVIQVCSTVDCHIKVGAASVATTSDFLFPAKVLLFVAVEPGQKVSFFAAGSGTASLYINDCPWCIDAFREFTKTEPKSACHMHSS